MTSKKTGKKTTTRKKASAKRKAGQTTASGRKKTPIRSKKKATKKAAKKTTKKAKTTKSVKTAKTAKTTRSAKASKTTTAASSTRAAGSRVSKKTVSKPKGAKRPKTPKKEPDTLQAQASVAAAEVAESMPAPVEAVEEVPAEVPVENLPTEEIWGVYREARNAAEDPRTDPAVERVRNVLMERHYPLVKYIAERLLHTLPKSIELDDLISAGLFGLMDAIRGFDPDRGIKFKTYCTTRIRGSILDQLRTQDWVPRLVRLKASRIDKALQKLTGEFGREPTHAELAANLEMDHAELSREMTGATAKSMFSLSDKWEDRDDDSSLEKVDVLEDKKSIDPMGEMNRRDMMQFITRSLTHKERFIIEQYYSVGHTMREIGEMLALTESRVCQIHSNVMIRLKSLFGQKPRMMS